MSSENSNSQSPPQSTVKSDDIQSWTHTGISRVDSPQVDTYYQNTDITTAEIDLEILDNIIPKQDAEGPPQYESVAGTSSSSHYTEVVADVDVKQEPEDVHPTTLLLEVSESSEGQQDSQSEEEVEEPLIPVTVDTDERNRPFNYKETSAEAFNSFWKYKKFPKGPKVQDTFELNVVPPEDPHKKIVFADPVFDKTQKNSARHFGKARLGEANDITPNPERLSQLGKQIEYISERMSSLGDSTQERKEKMKLSSRICRMKRSANHEANKIKFAGLEREKEELSKVIKQLKDALSKARSSLSPERLSQEIYQTKVAGRTSEYVNSVLEESEVQESSRQGDYDSSD